MNNELLNDTHSQLEQTTKEQENGSSSSKYRNKISELSSSQKNNVIIINIKKNIKNNHNSKQKQKQKPTEEELKKENNKTNPKTQFTEITERMYRQISLSPQNKSPFSYNDLINNHDLTNYKSKAEKINSNKRIINQFIERADKDWCQRHLQNTNQLLNQNDCIQKMKKTIINKRSIKEFINDQLEYQNKTETIIIKMKKQIQDEHSLIMRDKPEINDKSIVLSNEKRRKNNLSPNTHMRLFHESNSKNKIKVNKEENSFSPLLTHKKPQKDIDIIINKLNNSKDIVCQKDNKQNTQHATQSSNLILFNKTVKNYNTILKSVFPNEEINNNSINVSYENFKIILIKLGYIKDNNNTASGCKLVNTAWELLTKSNDTNQIDSMKLLAFIICVLGLHEGHQEEYKLKYNFTSECIQYMNTHFTLFKVNQINNHSKDTKALQLKYNNNDLTFKPLINQLHQSNTENLFTHIQSDRNLAHSNSKYRLYGLAEIIQKKHINMVNKHQSEIAKAELSQCTFKPKIVYYSKSPTQSTQNVTERLYLRAQRQQRTIDKKYKDTKEQNQLNEIKQCTFKPSITQLSNQMFHNNPLRNDIMLLGKIEHYHNEKAEKEIKGYKIENGWNLKNKEDIILRKSANKKKIYPPFKFDNEKIHNKETFEKFEHVNIQKGEKELILSFDIKINDIAKIIDYYKGEIIEEKIDQFCKYNNLDNSIKEQLEYMIRGKMLERDLKIVGNNKTNSTK